jgi:hypothetical protein
MQRPVVLLPQPLSPDQPEGLSLADAEPHTVDSTYPSGQSSGASATNGKVHAKVADLEQRWSVRRCPAPSVLTPSPRRHTADSAPRFPDRSARAPKLPCRSHSHRILQQESAFGQTNPTTRNRSGPLWKIRFRLARSRAESCPRQRGRRGRIPPGAHRLGLRPGRRFRSAQHGA